MLLLASFGALALALASIGLYGVVSYSDAQRTPEIGLRIALGAQGRDTISLILNQGTRPAVIGIAAELCGAMAVARAMASFLYGIRLFDALTFSAVPAPLVVVTLLACALPGAPHYLRRVPWWRCVTSETIGCMSMRRQ